VPVVRFARSPSPLTFPLDHPRSPKHAPCARACEVVLPLYRGHLFSTFCHPTSYVLPLLLQVFHEAASVVVAEPAVFALVPGAAELSRGVVALTAQPEVVSLAAELSPGVVVLAAQPEVVCVAVVLVGQPVVVFGVLSVADVAGPQVSVDIAVAFVVLVPLSVLVVEGDSSGRPTSPAVPSGDSSASPASSVAVVGGESGDSPTGVRANRGCGRTLAIRGRHQNRTGGPGRSTPTPAHNTGTDTTALPRDATTTRSRRTGRPLFPAPRTHWAFLAPRSPPAGLERRWGAAAKCQY
jgi:hypothetical protein